LAPDFSGCRRTEIGQAFRRLVLTSIAGKRRGLFVCVLIGVRRSGTAMGVWSERGSTAFLPPYPLGGCQRRRQRLQ
jgi:hypothetical protein